MSKITKTQQTSKPEKSFKILWVDPETHQKARILAAKQGVSIKEIISLAVQNYTIVVN
ncbi:MAG: hypothetical protein J0L60_06770 [Ignavibacteria bacterium]|nr:hypothetical protein [Ignavibacteria bacterium]